LLECQPLHFVDFRAHSDARIEPFRSVPKPTDECNDGRWIMRKSFSIIAAAAGLFMASGAFATTVTDPVGDFASGYTGPHQADLDVTGFSVSYDSSAASFLLESTMAGARST
jgi:hypothetical protein